MDTITLTIATSSRAAHRGEHPAADSAERPRIGVGIDVVSMPRTRNRDAPLRRGSERPGRAGEQGPKATFVSRGVIYARAQSV